MQTFSPHDSREFEDDVAFDEGDIDEGEQQPKETPRIIKEQMMHSYTNQVSSSSQDARSFAKEDLIAALDKHREYEAHIDESS